MSFFNAKILDGYAVNNPDGYSFVSSWIDVKQAFAYAISVTFTGTATGTLKLQSSNESDIGSPWGVVTGNTTVPVWGPQPQSNGLDAKDIPSTSTSITSAGVTEFDSGTLFNSSPGHRWVRVVYTGTAGTGTVVAWVSVKF